MKKVFSIALAVLMIAAVLAVSAFADGAVVSAPVIESEAGATETVTISISGNPGISAMRFQLTPDSRLTKGEYSGGNGFYATYIDYVVLDNSVDVTADGTIFTLNVTVPEDAQPGDEFPITLAASPTGASAVNVATENVDVSFVSGKIVIPVVETPEPETPTPTPEPPTPTPAAPIVTPTPTPAPNPGTSPRTGDSLFIGLCLLAVCGGAAFVIVSKKRSAEK